MNVRDVTLLSNSAGETAASLFIWMSVWSRASWVVRSWGHYLLQIYWLGHYTICAAAARPVALERKRLGFGHLLNCVFLQLSSYCLTDGLKGEAVCESNWIILHYLKWPLVENGNEHHKWHDNRVWCGEKRERWRSLIEQLEKGKIFPFFFFFPVCQAETESDKSSSEIMINN